MDQRAITKFRRGSTRGQIVSSRSRFWLDLLKICVALTILLMGRSGTIAKINIGGKLIVLASSNKAKL